jgi:hypothetical protein
MESVLIVLSNSELQDDPTRIEISANCVEMVADGGHSYCIFDNDSLEAWEEIELRQNKWIYNNNSYEYFDILSN